MIIYGLNVNNGDQCEWERNEIIEYSTNKDRLEQDAIKLNESSLEEAMEMAKISFEYEKKRLENKEAERLSELKSQLELAKRLRDIDHFNTRVKEMLIELENFTEQVFEEDVDCYIPIYDTFQVIEFELKEY